MGASSTRLRTKVREVVGDTILDAAEEIALEAGIEGVTIARVAERAGVAVGTLYNHFTDREGIIEALFRKRHASIGPTIAEAAEAVKSLSFEPRLRQFVRRLVAAFEREARFLKVAVLVDRDGSKLRPRDTTLMRQTVQALEDIMRAGARGKLFPVERAPIYARMLHGALRSMFLWRACSGQESMCTDGDLVVDTFLRGVMNDRRQR